MSRAELGARREANTLSNPIARRLLVLFAHCCRLRVSGVSRAHRRFETEEAAQHIIVRNGLSRPFAGEHLEHVEVDVDGMQIQSPEL